MYPSLIVSYGIVPPHLGKEFLEVYDTIRQDRLFAKKHPEISGNKIKNSTYKLALNGFPIKIYILKMSRFIKELMM